MSLIFTLRKTMIFKITIYTACPKKRVLKNFMIFLASSRGPPRSIECHVAKNCGFLYDQPFTLANFANFHTEF